MVFGIFSSLSTTTTHAAAATGIFSRRDRPIREIPIGRFDYFAVRSGLHGQGHVNGFPHVLFGNA
jgi:hypothetical protein